MSGPSQARKLENGGIASDGLVSVNICKNKKVSPEDGLLAEPLRMAVTAENMEPIQARTMMPIRMPNLQLRI